MRREKTRCSTPGVVVSRLTRYLTWIHPLRGGSERWISSREMAEYLGIPDATIRRDLAGLDVGGVTNRGYEAEQLYKGLAEFLSVDSGWRVVVVGAGNLGKAFALNGNLSRLGFDICAIFDCDGRKTDKKVGNFSVLPMTDLPGFVREREIDIGVIAVPPLSAQAVADIMIVSGIKGVFNLSSTHVVTPEIVSNVEGSLVASILELSHALKHNLPKRGKAPGKYI